jgi:hypothetical protein
MTYSEKLKDPRWQKKRLEVLEENEWRCEVCFDDAQTLHVHHDKYIGEPWETPNEYLFVLCEECHSFIHKARIKAYEYINARNQKDYDNICMALEWVLVTNGLQLHGDKIHGFAVKLINKIEDLSIAEFMAEERLKNGKS